MCDVEQTPSFFFVSYAMTYFLNRLWNRKCLHFSLQYGTLRCDFVVNIPVVKWRTRERLFEKASRK